MAHSNRLLALKNGLLTTCSGGLKSGRGGSSAGTRKISAYLCQTRCCTSKSDIIAASESNHNDTSSVLRKRPLTSSPLQQPSAGLSQAAPQAQPQDPDVRRGVPLTDPLPGLPPPIYAKPLTGHSGTRVSTLPNGLRVASEPKFGEFCTVGVAVDSGSRYEVAQLSGLSHFVDKLAFGPTPRYPEGKDAIMEELEKFGGICDCQGSRDTMIYGISVETRGLDEAIQILAEVVLRPTISPATMEATKTLINYELEDLSTNPNPEGLLGEYIHAAAFRDNTLGLPRICPVENVDRINQEQIYRFLAQMYDPDRIVLAGVGIDHDRLVEAAMGPFNDVLPIWKQSPELLGAKPLQTIDKSLAQYTGGEVCVEKDLSNVSLGPNPMPELAHIIIGLESPSHTQEEDFIATCVLNMLMGGGGSFSAGGPGKGMYTRLYLNVLNRYHWIQHAAAYNHSYADSSVFCIHASCHPSHLRDLVGVVTKEMVAMAGTVNEVEFSRAKKQLQSMLLMNLESRPVVFEDVARQVLTSGARKDPFYYMNAIEKVKAEDVRRIVDRMLRSKPSVAALGDLGKLPLYTDICDALGSKDGNLPKRFMAPWVRK